MTIEILAEHKAFDGVLGYYQHAAQATQCNMKFAVYTPPHTEGIHLPVLYYLAGLTCTEETFMIKSGAIQYAARHGIMLVSPDTSPRGEDVPNVEAWDFAQGAGFYLNATQAPWNTHYHMYDYVVRELPELIMADFLGDADRQGIFGHSMGGHGALTIALKNPQQYKSVSAFAPICAPMQCSWGHKAFGSYLGDDQQSWLKYDATELIKRIETVASRPEILIDQGLSDGFLVEQLHPHLFEQSAKEAGYPLRLRRHKGYDHGYYFISTFIKDHIEHHARQLT